MTSIVISVFSNWFFKSSFACVVIVKTTGYINYVMLVVNIKRFPVTIFDFLHFPLFFRKNLKKSKFKHVTFALRKNIKSFAAFPFSIYFPQIRHSDKLRAVKYMR